MIKKTKIAPCVSVFIRAMLLHVRVMPAYVVCPSVCLVRR